MIFASIVRDVPTIRRKLRDARAYSKRCGRGLKAVAQHFAGSFVSLSGETVRRDYCRDRDLTTPWAMPDRTVEPGASMLDPTLRVAVSLRPALKAQEPDEPSPGDEAITEELKGGWLMVFDRGRWQWGEKGGKIPHDSQE